AAEAPRPIAQPNPSASVASAEQPRLSVNLVKPKPRPPKPVNTENTRNTDQTQQPITVVMQIENGRVLKASIANHKAGMDSYEALALRIARQRRYPATTNGGEKVTISVARPE